jgi:hypothetical protein
MSKRLFPVIIALCVVALLVYFLFSGNSKNPATVISPDPFVDSSDELEPLLVPLGDDQSTTALKAQKLQDPYGDELRQTLIAFLKLESNTLKDANRSGCLGPDPIRTEQNSNFLYDLANHRKDILATDAVEICAHLQQFAGLATLDDEQFEFITSVIHSLERTIGAISLNVINETDRELEIQSFRVPSGKSMALNLVLPSYCQYGGPPPLTLSLAGISAQTYLQVPFCENQSLGDPSGYRVTLSGLSSREELRQNAVPASKPLRATLRVGK